MSMKRPRCAEEGAGNATTVAIASATVTIHPEINLPRRIVPKPLCHPERASWATHYSRVQVASPTYGFATTSCCTSKSSSKSKSEYRS